jgi:hypothetical protein
MQSARIRSAGPAQTTSLDSWAQVSRKRPNPSAPTDDTRRRLGRPSYVEQAGRQASQARLGFASESQSLATSPRRQLLPSLTAPASSGPLSAVMFMDIGDEL